MSKLSKSWICVATLALFGILLTGCDGGGGDTASSSSTSTDKTNTLHITFQAQNRINWYTKTVDSDFTFTGESATGTITGTSQSTRSQFDPVTWDVTVVYYHSVTDHKILMKLRDSTVTIDVHNNYFTISGWGTAMVNGAITQK